MLFKFDFGILITFGYIAILVFCHFACIVKCQTTPTFGEFWGLLILPPKCNSHYSDPQKAHTWVKTRRLSHQP